MIRRVRIQHLGVIEDAILDLAPGLNVITGETGAGKTMVVSGLGLIFGARADAGTVRSGADRAVVEGEVDLAAGHPALVRAEGAGADVDDALILVRTVSAEGRSRAHVGGRAAPVGLLAELAEGLIAVHGQADQWRLRQPEQHRALLDGFAARDPAAHVTFASYREAYRRWRELAAELDGIRGERVERTRRAEMLRSALEEIEQVAPTAGEEDDLVAEERRLANVEHLLTVSTTATTSLVGGDLAEAPTGGNDLDGANALDLVGTAVRALHDGAQDDPELTGLAQRAQEITYLLAELGSDLGRYTAQLDLDPARLAWVQDRRAELGRLLRKYGASTAEVLAWAQSSAAELVSLDVSAERIEELAERVAAADAEVDRLGAQVREIRHAAATELSAKVTAELAHLAMGAAAVEVAVTEVPRGPDGADQVEIRLAANPGAPARSVTRAASGGELSRVMLALELVSSDSAVPTFVFDEVDAGVGGAAALDLGARLARVAEHSQVIVVTHLAQVAAFADQHLVVHKSTDGAVTSSGVRVVSGPDRVAEIARMLGGVSDSAAALRHAEELLAAHVPQR